MSQNKSESKGAAGNINSDQSLHDLMESDSTTEWTECVNRKKRTRANTGSNSDIGTQINIREFEILNIDDKLSILFAQSNCMNEKIDECLQLQNKVKNIENELSEHDFRLKTLEYKSIDLEARSRRNNLIFGGISERKNEDCFTRVAEFLRENLNISPAPRMSRAHRLGKYNSNATRAIIVNFIDTRDVDLVLSNASMLKKTSYNINRDFPREIVLARKQLWPKLKSLREDFPDSKINIVFPAKLIMDGKVVSDAFPHWNSIMKTDRVIVNKPVFTNIPNTRSMRSSEVKIQDTQMPLSGISRETRESTDINTDLSGKDNIQVRSPSKSCSISPSSRNPRNPRRAKSRSPGNTRGARNRAPSRPRMNTNSPKSSTSV